MKGNDFTSVVETFLSRAHKSPWRQTDRHTKQRNSIIIIRTTRVMTYTQRTAFKPDYFNFQKLGHPKKTKTKNKTKNKHIYIYNKLSYGEKCPIYPNNKWRHVQMCGRCFTSLHKIVVVIHSEMGREILTFRSLCSSVAFRYYYMYNPCNIERYSPVKQSRFTSS